MMLINTRTIRTHFMGSLQKQNKKTHFLWYGRGTNTKKKPNKYMTRKQLKKKNTQKITKILSKLLGAEFDQPVWMWMPKANMRMVKMTKKMSVWTRMALPFVVKLPNSTWRVFPGIWNRRPGDSSMNNINPSRTGAQSTIFFCAFFL